MAHWARAMRVFARVGGGAAVGWACAGLAKPAYAEMTRIPIGGGGVIGDGSAGSGTPPPSAKETYSIVDVCGWAAKGESRNIAWCLKNGSVDVNDRHPLGWTPLMAAAVNGHADTVRVLLDHGAAVHAEDQWVSDGYRGKTNARQRTFPQIAAESNTTGFTALHYAVLSGDGETAGLLVRAGAKPNKPAVSNGTQTGNPMMGPAVPSKQLTPMDLLKYITPEKMDAVKTAIDAALKDRQEYEKVQRLKYPLEDRLKEKIVGQLAPIHAVASAVRRKENGWHDPTKPLVFLFLGSSGIGKTELAKQLASYLHDGSGAEFIRVDMSEYQHSHEVAKFIGSPPGYVGHEQGGQLTTKLLEKPDSVVLLDEVEKAHPDVLTVLLQTFDEGRMTDGQGKTVDCKDAIFVLTSNLGQQKIADEAVRLRSEAAANDAKKDAPAPNATIIGRRFKERVVQPILKQAFKRDEFIGRINEVLFFLPFTDQELESLIEKELNVWKHTAKERHNISLHWTPELVRYIKGGYNLRYGARSIKYEIDRSCISHLAHAHEVGTIKKGYDVTLDFEPAKAVAAAAGSAGDCAPAGAEDAAHDKAVQRGEDVTDVEGVVYARREGDVVLRATPPKEGFLKSLMG